MTMLKWLSVILVVVLSFQHITSEEAPKAKNPASQLPNLELNLGEDFYTVPIPEVEGGATALTPPEGTILASTIDGTLVAIDQLSGEIIWQLNDQPVVKSPYDSTKPILPAFLPDPKDGSIYMIGGGLKEPLKKLPFTIPELVAASPCKSSDGILYTGRKIDTWFSVDRFTGSKKGSVSFGGCFEGGNDDTCPKMDPSNFLIGRTEYNIMMYDSRADGRKWNISFYDYSTNLGSVELGHDYNFAHFTDSSMGLLLTLDRQTGSVLWKLAIGSPIVALYRLEGDGIVSLPFTSVSKETLYNLLEQFNTPGTSNEVIGETKLYQTLYVGEYEHGLYAMPSLVDEQTLTISPTSNGPLLLEGPQNFKVPSEINIDIITEGKSGQEVDDPFAIPVEHHGSHPRGKESVLLFGYYQVPEYSTVKISPAVTQLQLTSVSHSGLTFRNPTSRIITPFLPPFPPPDYSNEYGSSPRQNDSETQTEIEGSSSKYNTTLISLGFESIKILNTTFIFSSEFLNFLMELFPLLRETLASMENKELKVIAFLLAIGVFVLIRIFQQTLSSGGLYGSFRMSNSSVGSTSSHTGTHYEVTATPVELDNGIVKVGNIFFDPGHILGKGCEGTFVYKGHFDNRDVAVKRVLAACFSIADREVDLLRESDEHPNVVRYFCTEQDRQFRYIALEYCCATLQDFIDGRYTNPSLDALTILRQATQGVQHLHNLDIVHRDIKPHNVLISMPGKKGEVRAMISDFGLCKKLKVGRMSFSRRSGIAGTEGWIAPEMMLGNRSTTCAVDVFSLGCVYYFVLTKGSHPFGESFRRQANILAGEFNLEKMSDKDNNTTARTLIEKMLSVEHTHRPTVPAILKHPLFWSKEKVLNFLQDVSDRVDKESFDSAIVASLERNGMEIVRRNWYDLLDLPVAEDLRRHRTYNGKSVRDLLRALRNKKHHYQELAPAIKGLYGRMPDQYADYWMRRFPKLLSHVWYTMHCVKNETTFAKYFDKEFDFVQSAPELELTQDQTLPRRNPNLQIEKDIFTPHFVRTNGNGPMTKFETQDSIFLQDSTFSQDSIVSKWDNISTSPDDEFQDMSSSESNGTEPFELSPAEMFEKPPEPKFPQNVRKQSIEEPTPALRPQFVGDTPFVATHVATHKMVSNVAPPKIRQNVVQVNSDNLAAKQQKIAKKTWAQTVQNPKTANKLFGQSVEQIIEPNRQLQSAFPGNNHCDKENLKKTDMSENLVEKEKIEFDRCDDQIMPAKGPMWILPPSNEDAKKKKKKNKNKKPILAP